MQRIKTDFPYAIREIENTWIPLSDGTRLAARIWLPLEADTQPFPALLEYIPYRKNDGTAIRDAIRHPYLAGHGYACVRVDLRGAGESDGILYDEYLKQEHDDCLEVMAWIAAQPWCNGSLGMFGKSWGGFNSLQVASRRPPELKALITIGFTDDRYHDDVHYMGGCVLASQMLSWATVMLGCNAQPPDPRWVGDPGARCGWNGWKRPRLMSRPGWRTKRGMHSGSTARCARITARSRCRSMRSAAGAMPTTTRSRASWPGFLCRCKGLIGAWSHNYPEEGVPGPSMGFTQESLRWWDHWLKGKDTGVMDEPMLRSWILESEPPATYYTERKGHWVADPAWPSPHIAEQVLYLNSDGAANELAESPAPPPPLPSDRPVVSRFRERRVGQFWLQG